MIRKKTFLLVLLTVVALILVPEAFAFSSYLTTFETTYPGAAGSRIDNCGICHTNPAGGGPRNQYGADFASNGHNYAAIESMDSDGDGFTNIAEINARTFPGSASDSPSTTPSPTATPSPTLATLTSVKVSAAPAIDGVPDAIWDQATALTVDVSGGANAGSHVVTLKSVYTGDSVYFLAKWNDSTQSLRREPWQKQADGTWKQLETPNIKLGGENTFYEDKFSQLWNINTPSFETQGCSATCHAGENSDVKDYGNMYTSNQGEKVDIWHMKLVRTNPSGYVDDQYMDSTQFNATSAADGGRHSDPGLAPYYNNINAAKNAPNYTSATQPAQVNKDYWIFDNQKLPFTDTYSVNDEIAGIVTRPPTGDRADIPGKAVYANGYWTMEYGRKLVTGSQYDVQFSDLSKQYSFGTAIFDSAQTRHSYDTGVSKLVFAPALSDPEVAAYDDNHDGIIQKSEAVRALVDYFSGVIQKNQAIKIVLAYFG